MVVEEFTGSAYFRQILSFSTLSGKSVRISKIRQKDEHPGLSGRWILCLTAMHVQDVFVCADHEISFLRLLEKVTNGTLIDIDETGNVSLLRPLSNRKELQSL
jgi:RNA 3'-terminal phosphate cyclase-like protein